MDEQNGKSDYQLNQNCKHGGVLEQCKDCDQKRATVSQISMKNGIAMQSGLNCRIEESSQHSCVQNGRTKERDKEKDGEGEGGGEGEVVTVVENGSMSPVRLRLRRVSLRTSQLIEECGDRPVSPTLIKMAAAEDIANQDMSDPILHRLTARLQRCRLLCDELENKNKPHSPFSSTTSSETVKTTSPPSPSSASEVVAPQASRMMGVDPVPKSDAHFVDGETGTDSSHLTDANTTKKTKKKKEEEDWLVQIYPYKDETEMRDIMRLITKDLSEPYSIYTYRYFIHNWPHLCYLVGKKERRNEGRKE